MSFELQDTSDSQSVNQPALTEYLTEYLNNRISNAVQNSCTNSQKMLRNSKQRKKLKCISIIDTIMLCQ